MTAWYKAGTVAVTNGATAVVGTGTAWLSMAKVGDAISFDAGASWYEIAAVGGNTSITLAANYQGSTASGLAYAINHTSLAWKTTSLLFAACAELLARFTNGWIELGINATPDGSNRLAVAAEASRFLPDPLGSGDHVQRIDKAAEANDARTQYEVAGSPRARAGLIDGNDYKIQVSADGSTWLNVMVVDRTTGQVSFPNLGGGAIYTIQDTLDEEGDLPAEGVPAEAYLIDGDLWIWLPDAGVAGEWFNAGPLNIPGSTGAAGITGSAEWQFDTGTSDADPGAGRLRFNNADPSLATKAFISEQNIATAPQGAWIGSWGTVGTSTLRGELHVYKKAAPTTIFRRFKVSGSVADDGSYRDVTIAHVDGDGALANNDNILVAFVSAGPAAAGIVDNVIEVAERATPSTPGSGSVALYVKSDRELYRKDSAGIEMPVGGVPIAGWRNHLINPHGRINQRLPSSNADDTYGHDRWYALTQANPIAVSTQTDVEDGTPRMMRLSQSNASAQRMGYAQIIEGANCKHLRGKDVVLSGRVRMSASTNLRYAILEWTGTEDTVTSDVVNDWTHGTYTAGNFFISSNLTVRAVGSVTLTANTLADLTELTATLGSTFNNLIIVYWTESTAAQNVTLDAALEFAVGKKAVGVREIRPAGVELQLCQRYFSKSFLRATAPAEGVDSNWLSAFAWSTTGLGVGFIPFPTPMRVAPSVAFYKPSQIAGTNARWQWFSPGAGSYLDSTVTEIPSNSLPTELGFSVNMTVSGAAAAAAYIVKGNWTASAEL